jgi:bifunctional non-homologous end joining protein LigD
LATDKEAAADAQQSNRREVVVDGRRLKLTNLDKVLYPRAGFTKAEVLDYYARVAPAMLPHLRGRPLTLRRFPNGVEDKSFFEKRCPEHRPDWVGTAPVVSGRAGEIHYCVCDDLPTLTWLAQLAALELHPSLSLAVDIERPTVLAFDLDPGEPATIVDCARVALRLRRLFDRLGLESFAKTSGSKGLQVYVPLNTKTSYELTKPWARAIARALEAETPAEVTSTMSKSERGGRVFVDWSQNDRNKTTVAVYSLRARPQPTVSTPLSWPEVETEAKARKPGRLSFEADAVIDRVAEHGDLFGPVLELRQKLPDAGEVARARAG